MKNKYGLAAVNATLDYQQNEIDIVQSWENAVMKQFPIQEASRKKGCPKSAYLGLCEDGYVKGVPKGKYTKGKLNKAYAVKAVMILKSTNTQNISSKVLWDLVMEGEEKSSNSQMEVVLSLWNKGLINQ